MRPMRGLGKWPGAIARHWRGFLPGCLAFTPLPALADDPQAAVAAFQNGNVVVLSGLACGGVALAIAAGLWALAEQRAARRLRRSLRQVGTRTKAALSERDALLSASREALLVWGRDGSGPFSYGGGNELLQSCLKGTDALALSSALDGLSDRGVGFQLKVHDSSGRLLVARGRAVGSMAAVWLEEQAAEVEQGADYKAILDALPIPVWLRDKGLALAWGNHAFVKGAGARDLVKSFQDWLMGLGAEFGRTAGRRSRAPVQTDRAA